MNISAAVDTPAFVDFGLFGAGHHVPGGQFHLTGGVILHEPFAFVIGDMGPFTPGRFGKQYPVFVKAGGMELDKFHIFQRQAAFQDQSQCITGIGMGIGSNFESASIPARGQ